MTPSSTPLQEDTQGIVRQLVAPLMAAAARSAPPALPPRGSITATSNSVGGGGTNSSGGHRRQGSASPCVRLWDLVPRADAGPPQLYVVHAWGARLIDVARQLAARLTAAAVAEAGGADSVGGADLLTTGSAAEALLLGRTYVWMDFLALAQPAFGGGGGAESSTEDGDLDLLLARSVISSCRCVCVCVCLCRKWGGPSLVAP